MARLAPLVVALAALAAGGCSPPPGHDSADGDLPLLADAGEGIDGGPSSPADAGPRWDASATADATTTADAEVAADAGPSPADAAMPTDAACPTPAECAAVAEQRAADRLDAITSDPGLLTAFLRQVPKGGDLHMHLSGAVYAETYLDWAATEGYCINSSSMSLTSSCGAGTVPIPGDDELFYQQVVDAWSMQDFQPGGAESGHDHFFATFGMYGAISGSAHHGKMLADVMSRADGDNEGYLELMLIAASAAGTLGQSAWTSAHGSATLTAGDFDTFRQELLANSGWAAAVQPIVADVAGAETVARGLLSCATAQPQSACRVATRYEVYVSRSGSATNVFAQLVAAYEAAIQEPRIVAVNLVGPEDNSTALARYDIEMSMLANLKAAYAGKSPLRISLHAGELSAKYMPSGWSIGTINHVRKAVEVAGAERIGHGADIMSETDPQGLLAQLAQSGIAVEVCLSSNVQILEVSGAAHPLSAYLAAKVPVSLATDDQAVSRTSIAGEWTRAVTDQHLRYRELKTLARNSLHYSFLPGTRLFGQVDPPTPVAVCAPTASSLLGDEVPPTACAALLAQSPRAQAQWDLEKRYRAFEAAQ